MTALRRTATPRAMQMQFLDLSCICDLCNRPRANRNHAARSRKRQAIYAKERMNDE